MPIHDWARVTPPLFHSFYLGWVTSISTSLNREVLPSSHYAMTETIRDGRRPSFVELPEDEDDVPAPVLPGALLHNPDCPPRTSFHDICTHLEYAEKVVTIRQSSFHNVVAAVRIVAADTKRSRYRLSQFVGWAVEAIRDGVSLLLVDPFAPGPLNPQGIHKAIWDEFIDNDFALPTGKPFTLVSYVGGPRPEAFVEPAAVGSAIPEMPLFLTPATCVSVPLEATYQSAWEAVPSFWQDVLTA